MKPNFKTQPNGYACGTIALQNAIIALGRKPPSYKHTKFLCNTTRDGTNIRDVKAALRFLNYRFKRCNRRAKKNGVYIAVIYTPEYDSDHFVTFTKWGVHNNFSKKLNKFTKCSKAQVKNKILWMAEVSIS